MLEYNRKICSSFSKTPILSLKEILQSKLRGLEIEKAHLEHCLRLRQQMIDETRKELEELK